MLTLQVIITELLCYVNKMYFSIKIRVYLRILRNKYEMKFLCMHAFIVEFFFCNNEGS